MKKMTALVLALGLTMPAHSWTLFPVRKEIVTVKETNYALTAVVGAVTLLAGLAGVGYMWHKYSLLKYNYDIVKGKYNLVVEDDESAITEIEDIYKRNAQTLRDKNAEIAEKQRTIDELRTQLSEKEEQYRRKEEELTEVSGELTELQTEMNTTIEEQRTLAVSTVSKLTTKARQAQEQLERTNANLQGAQSKIRSLETAVQNANRMTEQIRQNLGLKDTLIAQLKNQIVSYRNDIKYLNDQLKEAKK